MFCRGMRAGHSVDLLRFRFMAPMCLGFWRSIRLRLTSVFAGLPFTRGFRLRQASTRRVDAMSRRDESARQGTRLRKALARQGGRGSMGRGRPTALDDRLRFYGGMFRDVAFECSAFRPHFHAGNLPGAGGQMLSNLLMRANRPAHVLTLRDRHGLNSKRSNGLKSLANQDIDQFLRNVFRPPHEST